MSKLPTMLGFCGYARAGKNTSAEQIDILCPSLRLQQLGFSDTLKHDLKPCIDALALLGADTKSAQFKELFRPMWVLWSRVAKNCTDNELIWVDRVRPAVDIIRSLSQIPTFTDVRYWYEIDYIHSEGGQVFYLNRPGFGPANAEEENSFAEIFERYPELYSNPVSNTGSKEDLGREILSRLNLLTEILA